MEFEVILEVELFPDKVIIVKSVTHILEVYTSKVFGKRLRLNGIS